MPRHLLMRLEAPLVAFGGETIDNYGVIRDFPALSMVTGLLANALGWGREEDDKHNALQARLLIGARVERPGSRITDFQTAQLGAADKAVFRDDHGNFYGSFRFHNRWMGRIIPPFPAPLQGRSCRNRGSVFD